MKNIKIILLALGVVLTLVVGYFIWHESTHDHSHEKENILAGHDHGEGEEGHDDHENTTTVSLTDEQANAIGLTLGAIERKNLTSSLKASGLLTVPNQYKGNATSLYGGVVRTLLVQPGSVVKQGQVVATIANPQYIVLQEEFLTLQPKIVYAEQEMQRQKDLNAGNAGALKNLQQAENELAALRTRRASLREQISLMGINPDKLGAGSLVTNLAVRAPVSGTVSQVMVKIGSYIDQNTPVAEIVDNRQLHLDLFVYEQDLPQMKVNQTIHFTLTNNPGREYDAEIYSIGTAFEQNTKTIPVHARVKGRSDGLIEGMNITGIVSLSKSEVPAVPVDAIVTHEGQDFIFIQTDAHAESEHHEKGEPNHTHAEGEDPHDHAEGQEKKDDIVYEKIPVRRGTTEVGYAEITPLAEVPAGAKIVTKGAFFLLAKMTNQGEGHAH